MAEFTHNDLRSAREARKIQRWRLANELGVSEDTVRRWEIGETQHIRYAHIRNENILKYTKFA